MQFSNPQTYALHAKIVDARKAGLTMPDAITAYFDDVARLEANLASLRTENPMADAIKAARADKLTDKALLAISTLDARRNVLAAALDEARLEFASVVARVRHELIDTIRVEVFAPALAELEALAEATSDTDTIESLLRRGKADLATKLVEAEGYAASIRKAHELAVSVDHKRSLKNPAHIYRNFEIARKAIDHGAPWSVASLLSAIRAGSGLWLPTAEQLSGATAAIDAENAAHKADPRKRIGGDAPAFFPPMR